MTTKHMSLFFMIYVDGEENSCSKNFKIQTNINTNDAKTILEKRTK